MIKAQSRVTGAKSELHKLRDEGKIPAVVYGKKVASTPIFVDEKELLALIGHDSNQVMDMQLPEQGKQPVMIHHVQKDPIYRNILHIDFLQVDLSEQIETTVKLEQVGKSPALQTGGILQTQLHEVKVKCLPQNIPSLIEVDISGLRAGGHITAGELSVPAGVELVTDPEEIVVTVLAPQKEEPLTGNEAAVEVAEQEATESEKA